MFAATESGTIWGGFGPPPEKLLDKERPPPTRPVPVTFPSYAPIQTTPQALNRKHMSKLRSSLLSIRGPNDVKDQHFYNLNIQYTSDESLSDFVPKTHFESRPFAYDDDLSSMLTELNHENQDAFREVLRLPPLEGKTKPKLAYSRNFYYSLEDMSRYWDTSQDKYYFVPADSVNEEKTDHINPVAKVNSPGIEQLAQDEQMKDLPAEFENKEHSTPVSTPPPTSKTAKSDGPPDPTEKESSVISSTSTRKAASSASEANPPQEMKEVYRGYRVGSGAQMSPVTRVGTVRNLLKMVIYKFNCRDHDLSPRDRLRIKDVNIPVAVGLCNFYVMKVPADSQLARARLLEGPVMGISCRSDIKWSSTDQPRTVNSARKKSASSQEENEATSEKFDFLREIGGMLFIATQRARQGRTKESEMKTEQEKSWWTTKERWGGGSTRWGQMANEVFEDDDPSWSPEERRLQMQKRAQDEDMQKRMSLVEEQVLANNMAVDELLAGQNASGGERPKKKNRLDLRNLDADQNKKEEKIETKDGRRLIYTPPIRKRWYRDWTKLRANASLWDDKIIYKQTGKQGPFDSIYQISSLNHHVCLMKMDIHDKYVEWLEKGEMCSRPEEADYSVLKISRSKWFDLFDVQQRQEFLTGMWRLMCWINRDEIPKAEYDKIELAREKKRQQKDQKSNDTDRMDTSE